MSDIEQQIEDGNLTPEQALAMLGETPTRPTACLGHCQYDPQQPVIALDFDGVIAQYDGWRGEDALGEPEPAAYEFLTRLRTLGLNIILHSTRPAWRLRTWALEHRLDKFFCGYNLNPAFPEDGSRSGKPVAHVYIDDRAVRHTGDFVATLHALLDICDQPLEPIVADGYFEGDHEQAPGT